MPSIKIWNDVIKVVNQVRAEYYAKKKSSTYTSAMAMKEAWKSDAVLKARADYTKFKTEHPSEWERLTKEYAKNKKPRKTTKKSKN